MPTIEVFIRPNEARKHSSAFMLRLLAGAFYASGVIFIGIIYSRYRETGIVDIKFATILASVFVVDLALFYYFLKPRLVAVNETYTMTEQGIEVRRENMAKTTKFGWEEFSSFHFGPTSEKGEGAWLYPEFTEAFFLKRKSSEQVSYHEFPAVKGRTDEIRSLLRSHLPEEPV
jgi:hypothetical protein